ALWELGGAWGPGGGGTWGGAVPGGGGGGGGGWVKARGEGNGLGPGPRLSPSLHGVHVSSRREITAAPHVGEHLARRVVHHEHRPVLYPLIAHGEELAGQRVDDEALETAIEGGGEADRGGARIPRLEDPRRPAGRQRYLYPWPGGNRREPRGSQLELGAIHGAELLRALDDSGRRGVGRPEEGSQHEGLGRGEPMRRLAEEYVGGGADALQLAREGDEVEIGLEDLGLAPAGLDGPGHPHLPRLLWQRARTAAAA